MISPERPWFHSKRWAALFLGALLLLLLHGLGASPEVTGPLAWGVGAALTALVGGESMIDAKSAKTEAERRRNG